MFAQEGEDLGPAVGGLFGPKRGAFGVEERMAGVGIAMELVILAEPPQYRLGTVDLLWCGVLIVIAEQAEQRSAQIFCEIDGRYRPLDVELALVIDDHIAAPAIDDRIDMVDPAGAEIGVPAARAEADDADLAVGIGLSAQKRHAAGDIADHLVVRDAA